MPKPRSRASYAWAQGHEKGSVFASMTPAEKRAYKAWLSGKAADSRVFERGLRGATHRGRSARADFAEV